MLAGLRQGSEQTPSLYESINFKLKHVAFDRDRNECKKKGKCQKRIQDKKDKMTKQRWQINGIFISRMYDYAKEKYSIQTVRAKELSCSRNERLLRD